jgi:hypothetical protein
LTRYDNAILVAELNAREILKDVNERILKFKDELPNIGQRFMRWLGRQFCIENVRLWHQ